MERKKPTERKKKDTICITDMDTPQDWRNTGGPHRHGGKNPQVVARGGILRKVPRKEIKNLLDKFIPLQPAEIKELELKETLIVRPADGGWYDVFNIGVKPEKKLNDKRLRRDDADQLINEMG